MDKTTQGMSAHTPGPWPSPTSGVVYFPSGGGRVLATFEPDRFERTWERAKDVPQMNAARAVACLNACEGIADPGVVREWMMRNAESLKWAPGGVMELAQESASLRAQRDELLAALRRVVEHAPEFAPTPEHYDDDEREIAWTNGHNVAAWEAANIARAAIARAEGAQ